MDLCSCCEVHTQDCQQRQAPATRAAELCVRPEVKHKGARRIDFAQFVTALAAVAEARQAPLDVVVNGVLLSGGPASNSTRASYVKFHDDKVCA